MNDHPDLTALTGTTRTLSRPAPLELLAVPLEFPDGLPMGRRAPRRSRPWRLPSGPPTSSRSTATGRAGC